MTRHPACKLLLFVTCVCPLLWAQKEPKDTDVLYTRKGEEYVGRLQVITPGNVKFSHVKRGEIVFRRSEVQRVELGKSRPGDKWRTKADIDDPMLLEVLRTAPTQKDYPHSSYVTLFEERNVRLAPDGSARWTRRIIQKIFKERGKAQANKRLYYLSRNDAAKIDFARTITREGKVFPLSDSAIQDGSVFSRYPDYENLHCKRCAMKEVRPGSVIDYQTTVIEKKTDLLHPFRVAALFGDEEPIIKKSVRVLVPKALPCVYETMRLPRDAMRKVERPDGFVEYIWGVRNTPPLVRENFMPETEDIWPRVSLAPGAEWAKIGQAYARRIQKRLRAGNGLRKQVASMCPMEETPEKKAKSIYDYLVCEIRTIPVPFRACSLLPTEVNKVFERKYGNDLDKSALFATMLGQAGIEARLCFVVPQGDGALMKSVPSLDHFSQCVVWFKVGNEETFASVLDDRVPMGVLPADLQNAPALLIDSDSSRLIRTPLADAEREMSRRTVRVEIAPDGAFHVAEDILYRGQRAIGMRSMKGMKEEEIKKLFQQRVGRIHPDADLLSYRLSDLKDLEAPVRVRMEYRISDYALRAGKELMVFRLPNFHYTAAGVGKPTRVHPLRWRTRLADINRYTILLPSGWRVYYVCPNTQEKSPCGTYSARYRQGHGKLEFEDIFRRERVNAPASAYGVFKGTLQARARVAREWIVLQRR